VWGRFPEHDDVRVVLAQTADNGGATRAAAGEDVPGEKAHDFRTSYGANVIAAPN
jgi:hypothetical protein